MTFFADHSKNILRASVILLVAAVIFAITMFFVLRQPQGSSTITPNAGAISGPGYLDTALGAVRGKIERLEGTTLLVVVVRNGTTWTLHVQTDSKTQIYALGKAADANNVHAATTLPLSALKAGEEVMVVPKGEPNDDTMVASIVQVTR